MLELTEFLSERLGQVSLLHILLSHLSESALHIVFNKLSFFLDFLHLLLDVIDAFRNNLWIHNAVFLVEIGLRLRHMPSTHQSIRL